MLEVTLNLVKGILSNSLVQAKGNGRKLFFPDIEIKIICETKKSMAINLYISTSWIKLKMMKLVEEQFFVDKN